MPWIYGDSYGGVQGAAQAQRGQDSSDYFNALHAAMALQQQQQQAGQQDFQNQLGVAQFHQQGRLADAAAQREAQNFATTMAWHRANLGLDQQRFDWTKQQENVNAEREKRIAKTQEDQDAQRWEIANNAAQALNERDATDAKLAALPTPAEQRIAESSQNWFYRHLMSQDSTAAATDTLRPRFIASLPKELQESAKKMTFAELSAAATLPLTQHKAALDEVLGLYARSPAAQLIAKNESGKWVPTIERPQTKAKVTASDLAAQQNAAVQAGLGVTPPTGAAPVAARTAPAIASPVTKADFDALPSGIMFINPSDGKQYRKK